MRQCRLPLASVNYLEENLYHPLRGRNIFKKRTQNCTFLNKMHFFWKQKHHEIRNGCEQILNKMRKKNLIKINILRCLNFSLCTRTYN